MEKNQDGRHQNADDLDQDQWLVHVNDVRRGAAAGCSCPGCGQPAWVKQGDELSGYFAHGTRK